ncbi:hypothetical protein [Streptomyces sp. 4N124]|uniref:hypothetical protein n=1 Tax=Streptomyces sp. 4N124 TaxID=3457420 RepID=UPI003FCF39C5
MRTSQAKTALRQHGLRHGQLDGPAGAYRCTGLPDDPRVRTPAAPSGPAPSPRRTAAMNSPSTTAYGSSPRVSHRSRQAAESNPPSSAGRR